MKTAKIMSYLPQQALEDFLYSLGYPPSPHRQRLYTVAKALVHVTKERRIEMSIEELQRDIEPLIALPALRKCLHEIQGELLSHLAQKEALSDPLLLEILKIKAAKRYHLEHFKILNKEDPLSDLTRNTEGQAMHHVFAYELSKAYIDKSNSASDFWTLDNEEYQNYVQAALNNLQLFYNIERLKLSLVDDTIVKNNGWPLTISSDISHQMQVHSPLQHIFQNVKKIIDNDNNQLSLVEETLHLLKENDIGKEEFNLIYDSLLNFFIWQTNKGNKSFDHYYFDLMQWGISKGNHELEITLQEYRNYISYATRVQEYEWALKFSDEFKSKLPKEERETAYSFSRMRIQWNMKDYEGVIETLRNVEYKDITYNLNSKLALMTSFYELDEYEPLLATIRAFKVFLRRRRNVSLARKANFTDFCDALYNIMMADSNRDSNRITKARDIINANPAIPNNDWLLAKIEELKL